MKILNLVTDDDRRGAQVFATDLAAALERRGHDIATVALAPGANTGSSRLDVEVLGATRLARHTLRALRARARGVDVIAAHGSTTLPACAIATAGVGVPFVYRQISESLFWADTALKRARVRLSLGRAAGVVALSSTQADILVEHFGVKRERLRVIPNGVPGAQFHVATGDDRAQARAHLGLDDRPVVACVSALVPEKGVDLVIDAAAAVPDTQLVVAGDGPARAGLEKGAKMVLGDRSHFLGSIDNVMALYAATDVVVLASKGGDSMPAMLIEAGLCGLPSIATPVGAITDVVLDGETGLIVPIDDRVALTAALVSVLGDRPWAAKMGRAARDHCLARFEIDVVAAQWELALAATCSPLRPRRPGASGCA